MSDVAVAETASKAARPFLKWAGGKGRLVPQLLGLMPRKIGRYFEPFMGGAALFFARQPAVAVLSDYNNELVITYRAVRDDVEALIGKLTEHKARYDKERKSFFYAMRELEPKTNVDRAARMIFLNKTAFNGLHRENSAGKFNVPIGRYTNPNICDEVNLRACSARLAGVTIEHRDFRDVVHHAKKDDFVYFDPPYVPVSTTADFTSYLAAGFGQDDQEALAKCFRQLAANGVHVMLSNSDSPEVKRLYDGFELHEVSTTRSINSDARARGKKVNELVVVGRRVRR